MLPAPLKAVGIGGMICGVGKPAMENPSSDVRWRQAMNAF
jgi:hypothetical protein